MLIKDKVMHMSLMITIETGNASFTYVQETTNIVENWKYSKTWL
jgi:hypothetical protein